MDSSYCYHCNRNFFNSLNLKYHVKYCEKINVKLYCCWKCNQSWTTQQAYAKHLLYCGKYICTVCNTPFLTSNALDVHTSLNHKSLPKPKPYHCRSCAYFCYHKGDLYKHRLNQHGGGSGVELQDIPWKEDPFDNDDLRDVYNTNKSFILASHQKGKLKSTYNFPTNNLKGGYDEIESHLNQIYQDSQKAFKVNFSFGSILFHNENGTFRYYIPYFNNRVLQNPWLISSRRSISYLMTALKKLDIIASARKDRPSSAWSLAFITNVNYYTFSTQYPIGARVNSNIPPFIKNNHYIKHFDSKTNLCFFKCLAYNYKQQHDAWYYLSKWIKYKFPNKEVTSDMLLNFKGVYPKEFYLLEKCFDISIKIYTKNRSGTISKVYDSDYQGSGVMFLNLYNQHFGFITNFIRYASKFECLKCSKIFPKEWRLKRHSKECFDKKKLSFPGGYFTPKNDIFRELEIMGIETGDIDKLYSHFVVWDMEALLVQSDHASTKNLKWLSTHIPVSVSVASNVEGYQDPVCFVNQDVPSLINEMVTYLLEISATVHSELEQSWKPILHQLDHMLSEYKNYNFLNQTDMRDHLRTHFIVKIMDLKAKIKSYITQLPVVGFNSGKYDINLIKRHLISTLQKHVDDKQEVKCIKRNNSYLTLSTEDLKFIDISNYLAPGFSYSQFLKAYGSDVEKGFFHMTGLIPMTN